MSRGPGSWQYKGSGGSPISLRRSAGPSKQKTPARLGRKEKHVSVSRIRVAMLGLLAVMLVGSVMAAAASAEAGPFWLHREVGGKEGTKVKNPENFSGIGGEQKLQGNVSGTEIEITSKSLQVKGAILNGEHQGQIKIELVYNQPTLIKPALKECNVIVNTNNIVIVKGHLMWKWNGEKKQLEEQPQEAQNWDIGFTAVEPQQQEPQPTKPPDWRKLGIFAEILLTGKGCSVLAGKQLVQGSEVGIPNLAHLNEFSKKLSVRTLPSGTLKEELAEKPLEGFLQHYWGGKSFEPVVMGLTFAGSSANLIGQTEVEAAQQEIAVSEK
jgi:hypothetical protein